MTEPSMPIPFWYSRNGDCDAKPPRDTEVSDSHADAEDTSCRDYHREVVVIIVAD